MRPVRAAGSWLRDGLAIVAGPAVIGALVLAVDAWDSAPPTTDLTQLFDTPTAPPLREVTELDGVGTDAGRTAEIDPGETAWYYSEGARTLPDGGSLYQLHVGYLADATHPRVEHVIEIPVAAEPPFAAHVPPVAGPRSGLVLYASDDGSESALHAVTVRDAGDRLIERSDDVIWSLAIDRAGAYAYYLLIDRVSGADRGLWRVALDGRGPAHRVLPPLPPPPPEPPLDQPGAPQTSVALSDDGRVVAVHTCHEECALRVHDSRDDRVHVHDDVGGQGIVGVTDEVVIVRELCRNGPNCAPVAVDIGDADRRSLPESSSQVLVAGAGGDFLVYAETAYGAHWAKLAAIDLGTDARHPLGAIEIFGGFVPTTGSAMGVDVPAGWFVVDAPDRFPAAPDYVGVRLSDGHAAPLPVLER